MMLGSLVRVLVLLDWVVRSSDVGLALTSVAADDVPTSAGLSVLFDRLEGAAGPALGPTSADMELTVLPESVQSYIISQK